ncbi:hypothetical protein [Paraferrimonas sedimenticola]|uniref:hypothetical protein n=1 Tax=Paraferrimonas sedimenticola TaxID=375674 RepID=UPI001140AE59|nr:hypothetical protein [Paraferrimonas sedimenticola]
MRLCRNLSAWNSASLASIGSQNQCQKRLIQAWIVSEIGYRQIPTIVGSQNRTSPVSIDAPKRPSSLMLRCNAMTQRASL